MLPWYSGDRESSFVQDSGWEVLQKLFHDVITKPDHHTRA